MKTFIYLNHQNKGKAFQSALKSAGWIQVSEEDHADICLVDSDVTPFRIQKLKRFADRGVKIFIYPHAARPNLFYDFEGMYPFPRTTAQFVVTETHKEVMERIGYPFPIHPVGWSYCQTRPLHTKPQLRKIVFAPIHANGNGWLSEEDKDLNRRTFDLLLGTARNYRLDFTVRYLRDLESCGLKRHTFPSYVYGTPDQSYELIDRADLVVAHQTYAWISVARGTPTMMMGEDVSPRVGNSDETYRHVLHWDNYKDLIMYPYDILNLGEQDVHSAMEQVACGALSNELRMWRRQMIGEQFDPKIFLSSLEGYLYDKEIAMDPGQRLSVETGV